MQEIDQKPVYVGQSHAIHGVTLTPEIISLDGETRLRIADEAGIEMFIPANFLPALAARASQMSSTLDRTLDEARKEEHHPTQRHQLLATPVEGRPTFSLPGATPESDGTPYITWTSPKNDRVHGWTLTITGIDKAPLGFAAWNDIAAQDNLIAMLADSESCLAVAGMTAPAETARMSARITARALRSARALPGIDLAKARKIVTEAGLSTPETINRYYSARMRLLSISSGDRQVPVAVAIQPPDRYENMRELTQEQNRTLTWQDRSQLQTEYTEEKRTPWIANTKQAFIDAGWRILDLAVDGRYNKNVIFATRIDTETWSSVAAAAQASARVLEMNRGGRI